MHWREFLKDLQQRGLHGLQLIISDDPIGLKNAKRAVFPSVPWQRCQFHLSQNAQGYAPKKVRKGEIAETMREIFDSSTYEMALEMKQRAIEKYKIKAPEFARWLEDNVEEGLTIYPFPREHWLKIRTSNGMERINPELRRRVRVAVLFPNPASALRLVTGVLMEIHEGWITSPNRYLDMSKMNQQKNK